MATQVLSTNYTLANPNDKTEWLAGGSLRNDTFPGGELFSTSQLPNFSNEKTNVDFSNILNLGLFSSYLLPALADVNNMVNQYDLLNLMSIKVSETRVIQYTITISDSTTGSTLSSSSKGMDISSEISTLENTNSFSLNDLNMMNENSFNLLGMLDNPNPINIAVTIVDMAYGKEMTFSQVIGAGLIGSIKSTLTSFVSKAVVQSLNLSTITQALSVQTIVGVVVGEVVEMALGLDTHFGFGGDFLGLDEEGNAMFAPEVGVVQGLIDTINEVVSFGEADTLTYNADTKSPVVEDMFGNVNPNPNYADDTPEYGFNDDGSPDGSYTAGNWDVSPNSFGGFDVTNTNTGVTTSTNSVGDQVNDDGSQIGSVNDQAEQSAFGNGEDSNNESNDDGLGIGGVSDTGGDGSGNHGTSSGVGGGGNTSGSTSGGGTYSCFVAGTVVKVVKNGKVIDKQIEDIVIGECLLGLNNSINKVIAYDRPITHGRLLYSFNGSEYFTTAEHQFLTVDGWKAISTAMALKWDKKLFKELNMNIYKSRLKRGDFLICNPNNHQCYIELKNIKFKKTKFDTQLYNFKLDGNNTYIANGFIVHNK